MKLTGQLLNLVKVGPDGDLHGAQEFKEGPLGKDNLVAAWLSSAVTLNEENEGRAHLSQFIMPVYVSCSASTDAVDVGTQS